MSTLETPGRAGQDQSLGLALFEHHPHAVVVVDNTGHVTRANAAADWLKRRKGGFPDMSELLRRTAPPSAPHALPIVPWSGRWAVTAGDGSRKDVEVTVIPVRSDDGPPAHCLCLMRQIVQPAQRPHQESESHFRAMADSAPVMIWMARTDRQHDWFSKPWLAFTGRTLDEERGSGWLKGVHPEDANRCLGIYTTSFDARHPFTMDYRLRRHDGAYRWVVDTGVPRYAPDGSFLGYVGSCLDIHERRDLEERLAERTKALRLADRRKDEFLAMLSHELRNPLAPIANAAGILRLMETDNPPLARVRQIVERQVEQLRRLVNDLVDVTRLTQGKIVLQRELVTLDEMVRSAVENSQAKLDMQGHTLRVDLPETPLIIEGDSVRLAQALANLISNAAKFTATRGTIDVSARAWRNVLRIRVKDPGQGIRPDFLPHVFDLFAQQDQSLARTQGGLGVGLTIAKRIAHLHGGDIEAYSEGSGRGAEFVLSLPLARDSVRSAHSLDNGADDSTPLRVLLVEDHADARDVLQQLLELGGNEVMTAANADEGLRLARHFYPQVVLCDIGLPGVDGFALIKPLREALVGRSTLFAALTGYGRDEDEARAYAAGFDAFLVKPLQPERLVGLLRSYASKLH